MQKSKYFDSPESPQGSILLFGGVPVNDEEVTKTFWDENGTATLSQAAQYAEIGKFQILLLIVCLIGYSSTSTVPHILVRFSNAVQCDYQLILEDRKVINDIVYVCMLVGGAAWSLMADTLSRKWTLICALFVYSMATFGLTVASTFFVFGFCRGIGAFSLSGIESLIITYVAEFQIRIFRGSMVCCLQLGWVIGMVTIPNLPYSWQSRILIATFPPLIAMIGFMLFPDSPRFLLSRGREKAAIASLHIVHDVNTGASRPQFPIVRLKDNSSPAEIRRTSVVKNYIPSSLEPKFICIPMLMFTQFVLMFSYYTLALWFPGMVTRSDAFFPIKRVDKVPQDCRVGIYDPNISYDPPSDFDFAKGVNSTIIIPAHNISQLRQFRVIPAQPENPCNMIHRSLVNKSSVMDALVCMPSLIWIMVKIDTIGRKFFITISHVLAGCLAFGSYFMHSLGKGILFSCLFDSLALLSIASAHCLAVELFPTRVRVLGVALVLGAGQLGTILADVGVAVSFGLSCVVVVALIALALATSGIFMMLFPDTTGIPLK